MPIRRVNVYCPLCGVILADDPYSGESDDSSSPLIRSRPWFAEVRGVYLSKLLSVCLTGVGIIRRRNRLHAPVERASSYLGNSVDDLEEWRVCDVSPGRWCFGCHSSCWDLLLLRTGQNNAIVDEIAVAQSVFNQLNCTPCIHQSIFQFGHDYGGATKMHKSSGPPMPIDLGSHFFADPNQTLSLEQLERVSPVSKYSDRMSKMEDSRQYSEATASLKSPRTSVKQFHTGSENSFSYLNDRLSPELMLEIMSYLSLDEIMGLRLVCRNFAFMGAFENLPQTYWRSRFCIGQEADFLFPDLSNPRDWRSIFVAAMHFLRDGDQPMANRKRIWDLLEPIATGFELEGSFKDGPHGSVVSPDPERKDGFQVQNGACECLPLKMVAGFSGQIQDCSDGPLKMGCRAFHHRAQSLPSVPIREARRILVSTVQIGARRFISGIDILPGRGGNHTGHGLGYHIPSSQKQVSYTSELQGITMAFCAEGLTGVKFTFQDSSSTDWLGNAEYAGVAFGRFSLGQGSSSLYLVAGLDNYKIVSLDLGMPIIDSGASPTKAYPEIPVDSLSSWHNGANAKPMPSSLWKPHFPGKLDVTFSDMLPLESSPSRFNPFINIDFGGPQGIRLGALTTFTCYMSLLHHYLIGIEASYSDGKSVMFGLKVGCKLSFFVNGQNGERINEVIVFEETGSLFGEVHSLFGLEVSTNHGRTASFVPLQRQNSRATQTLKPLPGNMITGLVATERDIWGVSSGLNHPLQGKLGGLTRIGIQSQPYAHDSILAPVQAGNYESSRHASDNAIPDDINFSRFIDSAVIGSYQTFASLQNVHKIIASTGTRGGSRSPDFISGLKIEYFNNLNQPPNVVGQWMNETDDVLELSLGEKIQSLTVWLSPVDFSTSTRGFEICQVAAIRIDTSHGRNMTFRASQTPSLSHEDRVDQYQCDPGEEITALSWILNVKADRLRVVFSKRNRPTQITIPELFAPYDRVPKLYFMIPKLHGSLEPAITAKAYYRNRGIIGLSFTYPSGKILGIGITETETYATVFFPTHSRVVGLSVAYSEEEKPQEIEFEVESDVDPMPARLILSVNTPSHDPSDAPTDFYRRSIWWKDELSAKDVPQSTFHRRDYIRPPKSKLVGVFVACQGANKFGAVYDSEDQNL